MEGPGAGHLPHILELQDLAPFVDNFSCAVCLFYEDTGIGQQVTGLLIFLYTSGVFCIKIRDEKRETKEIRS